MHYVIIFQTLNHRQLYFILSDDYTVMIIFWLFMILQIVSFHMQDFELALSELFGQTWIERFVWDQSSSIWCGLEKCTLLCL